MKAIFLNTWGGKVFEPLVRFLRESAPTTDFFCLQEIFDSPYARTVSWGGHADIWKQLSAALGDFEPYYAPAVSGFDGDMTADFDLSFGNAIFAKNNIPIGAHGQFFICGEDRAASPVNEMFPHVLQYVRFAREGKEYTLANLHGIAYPGTKRDTPERIVQSQRALDFLKGEKGKKILGGDFNLMPDTESIRMIEAAGMRNLIKEFGITTTRSTISYAQYPESDRQYFADYAFVSPGTAVTKFTVPQILISDHLPLIVEIAEEKRKG